MSKFWNRITATNDQIAVALTIAMSTMWTVYVFFAWGLLPLAFPKLEIICMYVSSTIIQLVALPLIMVGQRIMGRVAERRAEQDHRMIKSQFEHMTALLAESRQEITLLKEVLVNQTHQTKLIQNLHDDAFDETDRLA